MNEYIGTLLQSRTQTHIFHLQADSYEFHKTLQKYYEGIVDMIDSVVENYQGKYGIVTDYKMLGTISDFESDEQVIKYFETLARFCEFPGKGVRFWHEQDQAKHLRKLEDASGNSRMDGSRDTSQRRIG